MCCKSSDIKTTKTFVFDDTISSIAGIFCSDERFVDASMSFLKDILNLKGFDLIVTAGGPAFISADITVLMDNIKLLKEAHDIKRLVLISHEDCRYYAKKYKNVDGKKIIKHQHIDLLDAKQKLNQLFPDIKVESYFARINGGEIIFEQLQ